MNPSQNPTIKIEAVEADIPAVLDAVQEQLPQFNTGAIKAFLTAPGRTVLGNMSISQQLPSGVTLTIELVITAS